VASRVRVGVVGCGLVAQVMHLPSLRELSDRFEIAGLCDLSPGTLDAVADRFGVRRRFARWQDLLKEPLDAVMVLSSGSHAPPAISALERGLHVFVEKPMCLSVAEGRAMVEAAATAGVTLMVGYMKRYDPAYERLQAIWPELGEVRFARVTTLESPGAPYVAHVPLVRVDDVPPDVLEPLLAHDDAAITEAIGDAPDAVRHAYADVITASMIHELNAVRGLLGEPHRLAFAGIRDDSVTLVLDFGAVRCLAAWMDLPGIARYQQEWAFYAPDRRARLVFPSPYLRNAPTLLVTEEGEPGAVRSSETVHLESFDEAFRRELVEFHEAVTTGRPPRTGAEDALRDIALCQAIVRQHVDGRPRDHPSAI
jgi:predicted dehydrogenase